MLGTLRDGDEVPPWALILELSDRWHQPPWEIERRMTARWWYRWLDYRAAIQHAQREKK